MRALTILGLAAALAAGDAAADTTALTVAQAVERARAYAPGPKQLAALESAAQARIVEARAERLPSVDLGAGYTRTSNVPELSLPLPGGGSQTIFPNVPDNWHARLGARIPLYTGGRLTALADAALADRAAAAEDTATGDADLVLETTAAYWTLATTRESVRVLREGFAAYDQHLADARHREEQGLAPRSDVLQVRVERDRAELSLTRAVFGADVAEENLRRLTGIPPGTTIEIAEPAEPPVPSGASAEELVARALARRPERAALVARRSALEAAARAEDAARRPQVGAAAGYDYARPNREIFPVEDAWNGTWDVALAATFSVFDGGRSRAAAARSRAEADSVARQIDDLDGRVRLEVVARHRELQSALDAVRVAAGAVTAAEEARRILRDRYVEGVSTNGDYLDADSAWLRAGLDNAEALAAARLAAARLDRAVGR